ncbi:MAG: crossover junction endodeoxyribonuclease RuvC [Candidatus Buchananbacteria bacterium RBG_13_39_9]|uniref:Crossover junction endodeoxyribonuclease RuvC n=1 Tax=Candidatus Buchananbacteria bacterium RBG_13_39_9 TaxID=1797531 RepID=A0A1G1XMA2_9BACT|nr:MAG: crossover junction endodeoxyribonuclease RuvC [Candidatus Buchananbacteria bacterium RBG_13_39_9]
MSLKNKGFIIMGIDPGVAATGYAFIRERAKEQEVMDYGVIATSAKQEFPDRLKYIHQSLKKLITKFKPDAVCVEQLYFAKNVKTALSVGQARGVILLTAILNKLPLFEFTPLQIKQAVCGYGRADKYQVQNMVKVLLKLKTIPKPDDAADALAIALTYLQSKNYIEKIKAKP